MESLKATMMKEEEMVKEMSQQSRNTRARRRRDVKNQVQVDDAICTLCGKSFTWKDSLKDHKVIHEEDSRDSTNKCISSV